MIDWHDARFAPLPVDVQVYIEGRNHTGLFKVPFTVVYDGVKLLNAVKQVPVDPTIRIVRWRIART